VQTLFFIQPGARHSFIAI